MFLSRDICNRIYSFLMLCAAKSFFSMGSFLLVGTRLLIIFKSKLHVSLHIFFSYCYSMKEDCESNACYCMYFCLFWFNKVIFFTELGSYFCEICDQFFSRQSLRFQLSRSVVRLKFSKNIAIIYDTLLMRSC